LQRENILHHFRHRREIARYRDGERAERGEITLEDAAKIVGVCNMTASLWRTSRAGKFAWALPG